MPSEKTTWSPTSDIYSTVEQVKDLKAQYIDEDETTLAVGIFGFIGDLEAKKIQSASIQTGELGNEMFAQRAKLTKNIITHAIYQNIENINAIPASITLNFAIRESDIDQCINLAGKGDNTFIFDHNSPIMIDDYEFHFDYDIILKRHKHGTYIEKSTGKTKNNYIYNAYYDMTETNNISKIINPYLRQPMIINFNNDRYLFFQATARQVSINIINDVMMSASIIDNKSYTFTFDDQLADFEVYVTESGESHSTRLTPLFYGTGVKPGLNDYCWYLYVNEQTIRLGFDQNSYIPGMDAEIKIVVKTTLGEEGNFTYKTDDPTTSTSGFYVNFESEEYNYTTLTCFAQCATPSINGANRKTPEELQSIIPKMALSRGYITTETDLNSYFNLISTDKNRLRLQKKVDNQLNRIWYCYMVLKDNKNNVVPTNTLTLRIDPKLTDHVLQDKDGVVKNRLFIPAGTGFIYYPDKGYAEITDAENIPDFYSKDYFNTGEKYYYITIHDLIINQNPLFCEYFNTLVNMDTYFEYQYINPNVDFGMITNTAHIQRTLLSGYNTYRITFSMIQSVSDDLGLIKLDPTDQTKIIENNLRVYVVMYQNGVPYRYKQARLVSYNINSSDTTTFGEDMTSNVLNWELDMDTDNTFDRNNRIKILDLGVSCAHGTSYGFLDDTVDAYIYILAKLDKEYGRHDLDESIIDGSNNGWTVINKYRFSEGIKFFTDFTRVENTKIKAIYDDGEEEIKKPTDNTDYDFYDQDDLSGNNDAYPNPKIYDFDRDDQSQSTRIYNFGDENYTSPNIYDATNGAEVKKPTELKYYQIYGVPVVGNHYFRSESDVTYLVKALIDKKAYIDYCLTLVENNMDIDFKFFNTYGPTSTYLAGYNERIGTDSKPLGSIDTTWAFRMRLTNQYDSTTKDSIIAYIKAYIENLNNTMQDLHIPNLLHDIKEEYDDLIVYIEFKYFNDNALGVNHIILRDDIERDTVPEFICIRNHLLSDGSLAPDIEIEVVNE